MFEHFHYFIYQSMTCMIGFVPSPNALLLIILLSFSVDGAPHALIAKTKGTNHKGWRQHFKILHSCLMSRCPWEGEDRCLMLKTSPFEPCQLISQLGSALDNVDGARGDHTPLCFTTTCNKKLLSCIIWHWQLFKLWYFFYIYISIDSIFNFF